MRVLHIITRVASGGSERRLFDVMEAVDAEHRVIVGRDSAPDQTARVAAVAECIGNPHLVREVAPAHDLRAFRGIVEAIRRDRPAVVHTHQSKSGILGRLAAALTGVPIVFHSASMASFGPGYPSAHSAAFALVERSTAPLVTKYLVVGQDLADRLADNGIRRTKLEVIRSGLDLSAFTEPTEVERVASRSAFGVPDDAAVISYVGSLDERKRVQVLPALLQKVRDQTGLDVHLLVAGAGPMRETIEQDLADRGLAHAAHLLGHVDEVHRVFHAADVLVLPSVAEGVPQVVVQAAACRVPFVAFDGVDGVREMAALGARGAVAPFGNDAEMAMAVANGLSDGPGVGGGIAASVLRQWEPAQVRTAYRDVYSRELDKRGVHET